MSVAQIPMSASDRTLAESAQSMSERIRELAPKIEADRRVPDELIQALHDARFFRAFTPAEFGGDEVHPLAAFDAFEILAGADAAVAWVALIINANPYLLGTALAEEVWQETYGRNPDFRSAGHIAPNGRAIAVDGGYRVSGQWKYGSGSEHCEYLLSGCMVFDGDKPRFGPEGEPELLWIFHPTAECEILTDSWDTTGLRGSGSHDYRVDDIFVARDWTLRLGEQITPLANPLYGFPAIPFAQLAAITLALARKSIDLVSGMAVEKRRGPQMMNEDPSLQMSVAQAEGHYCAARSFVRETVDSVCTTLAQGDPLSIRQRALYRIAVTQAVDSATQIVDSMYKHAGGSAIYRHQPLERVFRDVHTAQTHIQTNDLTYVKAGRMLMGLDAGDPLF